MRSVRAILAAALIGAALLVSPASAFAVSTTPAGVAAVDRDGPFEITSGTTNRCLDNPAGSLANGTVVDLYACEHTVNQQWYRQLTADGSGFYWLVNAASGKCLTILNAVIADYQPLIQYTCTNGPNEEWNLATSRGSAGGTTNGVKSWANTSKCVTRKNGSTANNTPFILYSCNGGENQALYFDLYPIG